MRKAARLVALLLAAGCTSALTGVRRLQPARTPLLARAPRGCVRVALATNADEGEPAQAAPADVPPAPTGFFAKLKGSLKFDRKSLAKMGSSMILSYGFVSNVNAGFLIVISWATFRAANPALSPISFETGANLGTWVLPALAPKFLAVYGGYYATVGTLLRPVRFAVAAALGPSFTNMVNWLKVRYLYAFGAWRARPCARALGSGWRVAVHMAGPVRSCMYARTV